MLKFLNWSQAADSRVLFISQKKIEIKKKLLWIIFLLI